MRRRSIPMSQRRAFTLIELLVGIAIIAILAAILFPIFAQAREKARQSTCLSNVRQLTMGTVMYAEDYDQIFPNSWRPGYDVPPGGCWYSNRSSDALGMKEYK